jgi:hypothetical protein
MQAHYDVTRLAFRPNGVPPALARIERALQRAADGTRLVGAFIAEIGALNEVLILHALDAPAAPLRMREERVRGGDLFGVSEDLVGASSFTFASFPFVPPIAAGRYGPYYELREYDVKPGALPRLLAAWEAALPPRLEMSPLLAAAYALDGAQPRMLHLWPYRDLVERARIRGEAVQRGLWPPKGGAEYLATMRSSIYLPAPFSPLQ